MNEHLDKIAITKETIDCAPSRQGGRRATWNFHRNPRQFKYNIDAFILLEVV